MGEVFMGGSGGGVKFKAGRASLDRYSRVTINVGFKPDLAIIYSRNNNSGFPAISDNAGAVNTNIPVIVTSAYTGEWALVDNGIFCQKAECEIYYIAVKF